MQTPSGAAADPAEALLYREVLRSPWWLWLLVAFLAGSLGVAYGYALGDSAGWAVGLFSFAVAGIGLWRWATPIEVSRSELRVGPARLPLVYVGDCQALSVEQSRRARTVDADARAYLVLRTLVTARSARIDVIDPVDPHPYWLVSTRRPQDLVSSLNEATQAGTAARNGPATR